MARSSSELKRSVETRFVPSRDRDRQGNHADLGEDCFKKAEVGDYFFDALNIPGAEGDVLKPEYDGYFTFVYGSEAKASFHSGRLVLRPTLRKKHKEGESGSSGGIIYHFVVNVAAVSTNPCSSESTEVVDVLKSAVQQSFSTSENTAHVRIMKPRTSHF